MLSRLRTRLRDERGIALIMALGMIVVLSISVGSAVYYTSTNTSSASVSDKRNTAYSLAEAGINSAMSILSKPTTNALDKYALCPDSSSNPTLPCWHHPTYSNPAATCPSSTGLTGTCYLDTSTTVLSTGTVTWSGVLSVDVVTGAAYWTITSIGIVKNPTSPTTPDLTRRLVATITVIPTVSQPLNNPSWNYIFARAPNWSGVAFSGCDMTLTNSVNITANLYVLGNLCMQNTSKMTSGKLYVKGSLDQQATQNTVGTSTTAISEAHIGLGCRYKGQTIHNPCLQGAGASNFDQIWATILDNTVQAVTPPVVDYNGWYLNGSPGPYYPCQNASNLPTWSFDTPVAAAADSDANKLAFKNDNQGVINLTPSTSYTCQTIGGELSWNNTTKTLTIKGTMYIDGSATIQNGANNVYSGAGVIYLSGTFLLKNSNLCPISATTSCTSSTWNNQQDLLGIVAAGNGSIAADNQVSSGDSVQLVSSHMMGAIYATNAIDIGTTSLMDGPMDGSNVILGQSSNSTFSGFTYVPVGLPGETTVYAEPQKPTFSGG
jgi:Tfp pilus assembly protein PilX